ncbi:MAG TPA: hypothetical protein VJT71_16765 [Pyrinomonadaceae bacterium]|nr:hypothetical protein [Pyrinomonadaceae bacterium]
MNPNLSEFHTGVIAPVECFKEAWALIKDQYWLFLGIAVVGMLLGGVVPIVLLGPMMVGIYLCLFRKMRGEPVEFGTLFKGFDYFAQGLIAALIQVIPIVIVMVPMYIIWFIFLMTSMPRGDRMDPGEAQTFIFTFLGFELVFLVIIIAVGILTNIFFLFSFPLVADRNLSGVDAVKLSIKAGKANFGGILLLLLLNAGLGILGVLACYVGVFFIMPVSLAATAVAYRRVFPETTPGFATPPPPPPPGSWTA